MVPWVGLYFGKSITVIDRAPQYLLTLKVVSRFSRDMGKYDCTHIESLFSTYPYLTYSNKKSTSPVMTMNSTIGLREDIGNNTKVKLLWRRAETRNHSLLFPDGAL